MSAIFITTKIKGTCQYIKFNVEEQGNELFKEEFVETFILKGEICECECESGAI